MKLLYIKYGFEAEIVDNKHLPGYAKYNTSMNGERNTNRALPFLSLVVVLAGLVVVTSIAKQKESVTEFPEASQEANLLKNASFEVNVDGNEVPDNWLWTLGTDGGGLDNAEKTDGNYSVRILPGENKFLFQTITGDWPEGTTFVLKGWSKTVNVPTTQPAAVFRIEEVGDHGSEQIFSKEISREPGEWIETTGTFTLQKSATQLQFYINARDNSEGELYFDKVELTHHLPE